MASRRRRVRGRHVRNARVLLQVSTVMIGFDGDFRDLAALMGWTSGRLWEFNPAIKIATERWKQARGGP